MLRVRNVPDAGRRLRGVASRAPQGHMKAGKYKDLTFAECLAQHPSYCSWVLARGEALGPNYSDFLNFLRGRTQEAPADPQMAGRPAGSGGGSVPSPQPQTAPDPRDQNKVGFGKHKDLTYAELLSAQPGYCLWVQQTAAKGDEAGGGMRAFAEYLEGKTIATTSTSSQRKPQAAASAPAVATAANPRGTLAGGSWLVNFGKYKGAPFSEVFDKDPKYCEFITSSVLLAEDQNKAPSRDSLAFAAYIIHRARQEDNAE